MRPPVWLPWVVHVHYTANEPIGQLAHNPAAVAKHLHEICVIFWRLSNDLRPFKLKNATSITLAVRNVHNNVHWIQIWPDIRYFLQMWLVPGFDWIKTLRIWSRSEHSRSAAYVSCHFSLEFRVCQSHRWWYDWKASACRDR